MNASQKYSTLFSLYIAQAVPMSFFSTVLPVIMRMENFSMSGIALIQLIKLPWILKFLWAPMVDRNASSYMQYKRWIIASEIFYAACIVAIAFFRLQTDFTTIIVLMILAITFSATQDIASDALAIRILTKKERPFGNSVQSMGNFVGTLLGSGFLLIAYTITGWQWLMVLLAAFVLIALLPLVFNIRKKYEVATIVPESKMSWKDIGTFFKIPGIGRWVLILAIFYSGILGILAMLKPWMVDLGYNVKQIAFMVGIYGTGCGAAAAFAAGFIIRYLGQRKSIMLFAAYNIIAASFFLYIVNFGITKPMLYASITVLWSAYAMSSVIIYTVSMSKVRAGKEGTDYSIQIVITHLKGILIAIIAGRIADAFGMKYVFAAETMLAILVFIVVATSPKAIFESKVELPKKHTVNE